MPTHLVDAADLEQWAGRMAGRYDLPELIRRLVLATANPTHIDFRAQEGTGYGGWDGHVETDTATTYVPAGISGWEMGAGADPQSKANSDYKKRTKKPKPFDIKDTAFVFCTPRRWSGKEDWLSERRTEDKWNKVRAYDADDLATWLADAPGVHVWFSMRIGKPVEHVQDLLSWWNSWSTVTLPPFSHDLLLSGRGKASRELLNLLSTDPSIIVVRAGSTEEALAFVAAAIESESPSQRDRLHGRALFIDNPSSWRYFASQHKSLILIPRFTDVALVNQAVQKGHHVVVPAGADYRLAVTVDVPRLSAIEAKEVLEREGLASVEARHAAALARRSLAAYRRVQAAVSLGTPEWAQGEYGPALVPLVLAGEWDENVEGDREALERLAGKPYREIRALLLRWRDSNDAPFRLVGSRWSFNAKEDAWRLLAQYAMQDDLRLFVYTVREVLPELDPKRGLSHDKQLLADIQGKRRNYSSALRGGLADSLAMLGALGSPEANVTTADDSDTSALATWAVRELMNEATESPETWLDLAPHLTALAEAAPDVFLDKVEGDIGTDNPTLLILFEPQPGLLSPNYDHPYLLWALEHLAWSPTLFPRVALVLARLAAIAPQTKIVNSPFGSLVSFFRLWLPQCGASPELRLQTVDQIRSQVPQVSWDLMIRLLPSGHDSASVLSGPGARAVLWRDWPSEAIKPSRVEYSDSIQHISERILDDVEADPTRWLTLVEHLSHLHPAVIESALQKLEGLSDRLEDADLQSKLWMRLRGLIARHRAFADANWAIPERLLDRLDAILDSLAPSDPTKHHLWLFENHPQLSSKYESWQEQRQELEERRVAAIREILAAGGINVLFDFAERVEAAQDVGNALFAARPGEDLTGIIIDALDQEDARSRVAQNFIRRAIREEGNTWTEKHLSQQTLKGWDAEKRASALLCFPLDAATFDLVASFDEYTKRYYWRRINHVLIDDADLFNHAIIRLIDFQRPRSALYELAMRSHDEEIRLEVQTVQQALYHSTMVPIEEDPVRISHYDAERLLTYLRNHPDSDKEALRQLEWHYLPFLGPEHGELDLHDRLNSDPAFFVEVVGLEYKRDNQAEPSSIDPDDARRAYHLLESWRRIPGTQEDGSLDETYLKDWVRQAIALLEKEELMKGGLSAIGQMLSWGPNERDGVWPASPICDIVQDLSSEYVDESFRIAIYNSRGTTSRGPYDGGGQERQLAKRYENYAAKLDAQWPRVAAILRHLATGYRSEAKRHDQEAERDEDKMG